MDELGEVGAEFKAAFFLVRRCLLVQTRRGRSRPLGHVAPTG
jgi:hypothetical protein